MTKEEARMTNKQAEALLKQYPVYLPKQVAAQLLDISPRQLSWLVAEGRKPFASFGANIGTRQRYVRIYTAPLIRYLCDGKLGE